MFFENVVENGVSEYPCVQFCEGNIHRGKKFIVKWFFFQKYPQTNYEGYSTMLLEGTHDQKDNLCRKAQKLSKAILRQSVRLFVKNDRVLI